MEGNNINFSPNGMLLACSGAKVKVFTVATGKVDNVYKIAGEMVCWNNNGNRLTITTKKREKGHHVAIIDIDRVSFPKMSSLT